MTNDPTKPVVTQGALKPCPFCNSPAEMSWYAKGSNPEKAGYFVECGSCSAGGEPCDIEGEAPDRVEYTQAKAITAWNTRAHSSQAVVSQDLVLIEVERDSEGHVLMCTGCGTVETIRSIKARSATAFSCCPERKMVRATHSSPDEKVEGLDDLFHKRAMSVVSGDASFTQRDLKQAITAMIQSAQLAAVKAAVEGLKDPASVHVNMLRGTIAKPSARNIWHIYGKELLEDMPADILKTIGEA